MQKKIFVSLLFLYALTPFYLAGQDVTQAMAVERLNKEQHNFIQYLQQSAIDTNVAQRLSFFIGHETDSIQRSITNNSGLSEEERIKALKSIVFFMYELRLKLGAKKFEVYDIPDALETFMQILAGLLHHTPYTDQLMHMGPRRSQLMATAFWEYKECSMFDDIALYKRVVAYPQHIIFFLDNRPDFRYTDSLLIIAAANDPSGTADFLNEEETGLQEKIRNIDNIYMQEIVTLARHPRARELLPFVIPLAEKRITIDDILVKRGNAKTYFQLLVNTLVDEIHTRNDTSFLWLIPLRKAIKDRSIAFYVNSINELHGSSDEVRFDAVKDLRMEDLYYIISSCEEELYTSSYLGLYRRLMGKCNPSTSDSIFRTVYFDQFHRFMRMAANYNTMTDLLNKMPSDTAAEILKRFISGIESNSDAALEKAMDVSDAFNGLDAVPVIRDQFRSELVLNLDRCRSARSYLGMRLYTILLQVFNLVNSRDSANQLWSTLGDPEILKRKILQDKNGDINEVVLFYGDEDGNASYNNFMALFRDTRLWETEQNAYWMTIRSVFKRPITIYANLPLDNDMELDLVAQDSLFAFLGRENIEPSIIFHRGHSYHLGNTMKRIKPAVKLAILGSCGGYNNILSVADLSPDAQVIVSKKMGSKFINDPLFDLINKALQANKDLVWSDIWKKLTMRFKSDEFLFNMFSEYIPPSRNLSLFVLKLFNYGR